MSFDPTETPRLPERQFKGAWMSGQIFELEGLTWTEKALLAEIDSLSTADRPCFATSAFLANRLLVSLTHMKGTLSDLTRHGYLVRDGFNGRQVLRRVRADLSSCYREERLEALRSMPYRQYLETPEWQGCRSRKLKEANFRCQLCNEGGDLNVHHRTYENRGNEPLSDLIVLCRPCHEKFHGIQEATS